MKSSLFRSLRDTPAIVMVLPSTSVMTTSLPNCCIWLYLGFVAQIRCRAGFPFPRTDLSYGRCDGYAKSGVAVENGDADLDFRDLPIKVSCH